MTTKASSSTSKPFSFSLKTLLLTVTAFGIFLTPFPWFGLAYLISASLTAGLVIACIFAQRGKSPWLAMGVAVFAAVVGFPAAMLGGIIFFLHALLNVALCLLLLLLAVRPKVFAICSASLAVGVYGYVVWQGVATIRELVALKELYPLVSLRERLTFEKNLRPTSTVEPLPITLSKAIVENLDEQDNQSDWPRYRSRSRALEELHEHMHRQFAYAAGFGVSRMSMIVSPQLVELEPRKSIELPFMVLVSPRNTNATDVSTLHRQALTDFLDSDRMGYVRGRDAVAGFDAHGFSSLGDELEYSSVNAVRWEVTRLELVGLLRHDEPQVYVTKTLPSMDELADIPRRSLNDFESRALPQLQSNEDTVVDQDSERIWMLGAVRAGNSCLKCHEGERGKLLGAFSYEIKAVASGTQTTSDSENYAAPDS